MNSNTCMAIFVVAFFGFLSVVAIEMGKSSVARAHADEVAHVAMFTCSAPAK